MFPDRPPHDTEKVRAFPPRHGIICGFCCGKPPRRTSKKVSVFFAGAKVP